MIPIFHPIIHLILWLHMMMNPIKVMDVPHGESTILEALRANHEVKTAFICQSPNDIDCIDSLCSHPPKYWTIEVNGKYETVNSMSQLKPNDKLVLKYGVLNEKVD